jgi:release factor glutamine methyltransferase
VSSDGIDDAGDPGRDHDDVLTIGALWQQTTEVIGSRHEARWLCEVAVALDGDDLLAAVDEPATERMVAHLDAMVARYRTGEPLQYVLGRWGFRRLDLAVDRRVLIPRADTELVAGVAIELAEAAGDERVVADLGTGSGAIGLSLAVELPVVGTTVWITDADPDALAVARANLAGIGRAAVNVRVGEGSWFDALPAEVRCHVIVSNPPYVAVGSPLLDASVLDWEPASALFAGDDGLDAIRVLVDGAPQRLLPGGWLVLEHGTDQGDAVRDLLAHAGFASIDTHRDAGGHERCTVGRLR